MIEKVQTSAVNSRLWGARARDWADVQEAMVRPAYESVFDRAAIRSGTHYLDVGCGSGMAAQLAASRGARVTGIDAAEALLMIARSRVPGGDFRQGDLEELPFGDGTFDLVTGFNAFQYAGDPLIALREARWVAKRGGTVAIVTWGDAAGWRLLR
jgi:ubiquinone/menaquinone biosynthesis C-methylase UbiE